MATLPAKQYSGSILEAFLPKKANKTTATSTQTEQTQLTPEAINGVIRTMMESNDGLAQMMQRQAGSGLYNSSTAQLLANDLATRVGEKAALGSAPKTVTQTQTAKAPGNQIDPRWMLGLQLASELFGGGNKGTGPNAGFNSPMPKGTFNLGSMIDNMFGTSMFSSQDEKRRQDESAYNPTENYGGFGFTGDQMSNFSLAPASSLSLGSGGGYSYDPFSMTGGTDWLLGTGFSGGGFNSYDYAPSFSSSNYSLGVGNTGLGSSGLSFGFSF